MPTNITDVDAFTETVVAPASGDARTAASVVQGLQPLANRTKALLLSSGLLHWSHSARVATGGTNNGNTAVYVGPIQSIALLFGTDWLIFREVAELQLTCAANFASGTLANDTNYYVYATVVASALVYEISTTAPDAFLRWKTGGTNTHRYLFYFHTSSAGVALAMQMRRGLYLFRVSALAGAQLLALNGGAASAGADVILARGNTAGREFIPPHVRSALVRATLIYTGNHVDDSAIMTLLTKGDSTAASVQLEAQGVLTVQNDSRDVWVEVASDRTLTYALTLGNSDAGNPTATASVLMLGCQE